MTLSPKSAPFLPDPYPFLSSSCLSAYGGIEFERSLQFPVAAIEFRPRLGFLYKGHKLAIILQEMIREEREAKKSDQFLSRRAHRERMKISTMPFLDLPVRITVSKISAKNELIHFLSMLYELYSIIWSLEKQFKYNFN